jgi:mannosyl-glycoprotein endo-beta-N-acetylglucosaminidase
MDVDKQTAMGDLLWPAPALKWEAESEGMVPDVAVSCNMADSWNGGSAIQLAFTEKEAKPNVAYRSFYTPIQTLSVTAQKCYIASIIYKVAHDVGDVDLDVTLTVRPRDTSSTTEVKVSPGSIKTTNISNNWTQATIQFVITGMPPSTISVDSKLGLILTTVSNDTTPPFALTILLGQMNVYATPATTTEPNYPRILWADHTTTTIVVSPKIPDLPTSLIKETKKELTTITWEPATCLAPVGAVTITSPDDPTCAWAPEPPLKKQWFPGFLYYNIYAAEPEAIFHSLPKVYTWLNRDLKSVDTKTGIAWIGTSGADGAIGKGMLEFTFDKTQLPVELRDLTTLRVYVQGVLETGEVLSWQNCVYVDVEYSHGKV